MIWTPNGLLSHWGVRDFAGGIVVHNIAGFAALASVLLRRPPQNARPRDAQRAAGGPRYGLAVGSPGTA